MNRINNNKKIISEIHFFKCFWEMKLRVIKNEAGTSKETNKHLVDHSENYNITYTA